MRAGFEVTEGDAPAGGRPSQSGPPPDLLILSATGNESRLVERVRELVAAPANVGAPLVVLLDEGSTEAAAGALSAGAHEVLRAPVDLKELHARLDAELRVREELRAARDALRARDLLFDIFQEVSAALRADEIFQTLVRRVGQAFGLTHCSFVLTAPGESKGSATCASSSTATPRSSRQSGPSARSSFTTSRSTRCSTPSGGTGTSSRSR